MRRNSVVFVTILGAASVAVAGSALAQPPGTKRPPAFSSLVNCRAIAQPTERLACFDRAVAAMDAAEARQDLVIVDRQQINRTRRSLFGLSLPNLGIFGDASPEAAAEASIEGKIKRSWLTGDKWNFELEDGARWVQIDSRNLSADPKAGQAIVIRRAALGSYLANVNKQTAIRVKRVG